MKKQILDTKEPLDYVKVSEIAKKDFGAILETCEKEIDDEFLEHLGKDYDINLFSLVLCEISTNSPNNIIEYTYTAKYKGVPKYIYALKLFEDYRIFDNVFYPIKE